MKYFDYRIPFRGDAEWGMENLNGIYLLEFSVEADQLVLAAARATESRLLSCDDVMDGFGIDRVWD